MKKIIGTWIFLLTSLSFCVEVQAKSAERHVIRYGQAAPEGSERYERESKVGLGFSTLQNSAITGTIGIAKSDLLQFFFSIPSTSPVNIFGTGFFKHTIVEHGTSGFHLGGGLGVGTLNSGPGANLVVTITLLGGFHFELPSVPRVIVHLDGGPSFTAVNSNPGRNDFQLSALSPGLGASVLYLF